MAGLFDLRDGWAKTLNQISATVALTLTYNSHTPTADQMRVHLDQMRNRIDKELYGPRWHKKPRTAGWGTIEGLGTHPHWHIGLCLADESIPIVQAMLDAGAWLKYAPAGTFCLKPITDHDWAHYCVKDLTTSDHICVWSV